MAPARAATAADRYEDGASGAAPARDGTAPRDEVALDRQRAGVRPRHRPPGVGKTVAVWQWLAYETHGRRVAWLSLVKTHLKGVCRKLGATSRSEVVDRARTLDLK